MSRRHIRGFTPKRDRRQMLCISENERVPKHLAWMTVPDRRILRLRIPVKVIDSRCQAQERLVQLGRLPSVLDGNARESECPVPWNLGDSIEMVRHHVYVTRGAASELPQITGRRYIVTNSNPFRSGVREYLTQSSHHV